MQLSARGYVERVAKLLKQQLFTLAFVENNATASMGAATTYVMRRLFTLEL